MEISDGHLGIKKKSYPPMLGIEVILGDQGLRYAQPVGSKLLNGWGIYHLHGNVSEWCQDYYGSYNPVTKIDPQGADKGANRSVRGGAFNSRAREVRSADRSASGPGYRRNFNIGFRIVRRK